MMKQKVLCIVGPTASGKSALGLALSKELSGEIISMDSMQIYRRMSIGTAKPTEEEQATIPHHLVDILEPWESYTVAQYSEDAKRVVQEISGRGNVPIFVGGTGLYLQALTHGLNLGGVRSDPKIREHLKASALDAEGKQSLHNMLKSVDPITASKLHVNDVTRVSRALEVFELTDIPLSRQVQQAFECPFNFCILGTTMERSRLYHRINARVDAMIENGLLNEVKALMDKGISINTQALHGIGYKEFIPVLKNNYPLADAILDIKRNSRHYAKRQLTWFRRNENIHWLEMADEGILTTALDITLAFMKGSEHEYS